MQVFTENVKKHSYLKTILIIIKCKCLKTQLKKVYEYINVCLFVERSYWIFHLNLAS